MNRPCHRHRSARLATPVTRMVVIWRAKSAAERRMTPVATMRAAGPSTGCAGSSSASVLVSVCVSAPALGFGFGFGFGDGHVERGGVAPGVETGAVVQDLDALEAEAAPVLGQQAHRVPHVPGGDVGGVLLHQAEAAVGDPQPPVRQRGRHDRARQRAGRRRVVEQGREVGDADAQHEVDGVPSARPAALAGGRAGRRPPARRSPASAR